MKYFNSNQKAFTLIDILLTSAIISLLSSIFLFQVSEAKRKADDSHMKVEAQQVSNAIALYKNDNNGRVPLLVTAASGSLYPETSQTYKDTMQLLVAGGYIPEIPKSPDGQSYTYATDANNNAFFAFKLKQGATSSNRKNSCSVAVTGGGGGKTFTACQIDWNQECVDSSGTQCFTWDVNLSNNFQCDSTLIVTSFNTSIAPDQIFPYLFCIATLGVPPSYSVGSIGSGYICNYTLSNTSNTPTCDGSSTGDYCECI